MLRTTRGAKEFYEQKAPDYQEAKKEAFDEKFRDFIMNQKCLIEDVQSFLDNFKFPEEEDWVAQEYESALGDYADQAYEK